MPLAVFDFWDAQVRQFMGSLGSPGEELARILLAAVAGGLVGLEREVRGRQAGFRTYLLVCVGSAIVMLVSVQFATHAWTAYKQPGININVDPARIAYGVMTGVGFLGAGVIVHNKGGVVRGLTTGAGLWCVAAIGLAVGFGMYMLSALGTLIILLALWILDYFEDVLPKYRYRSVTVRTKYVPGVVAATVKRFKRANLRVTDATFERSEDLQHAIIDLHIAFLYSDQYYDLERQLEADPDYHLVSTREIS
jgi:putative Mg2+ transporter-C (MgtC) family protein